MMPFTPSQDLDSNSPYCQPYSSGDVGLENLLLDQLKFPSLLFFFDLITCLLEIAYCILYIVYCILYIVYCILDIGYWILDIVLSFLLLLNEIAKNMKFLPTMPIGSGEKR